MVGDVCVCVLYDGCYSTDGYKVLLCLLYIFVAKRSIKEYKRILRIHVQNHPPLVLDDELSTNILFLGNKPFDLVIFPVELNNQTDKNLFDIRVYFWIMFALFGDCFEVIAGCDHRQKAILNRIKC